MHRVRARRCLTRHAFNAAAGAAALCLLAAGCTTSPTGRRQIILVSAPEMNRLGDQAFAQLRQKTPVSRNARATRFVECVARHVTAAAKAGYRWQVTLFQSPEANAFALPGGKIGVYTGLLKYARTQGELAAVIGHEVGHVVARHMDARVSAEMLTGLGLQAVDKAIGGAVTTHDQVMSALGLGAQVGVLLPYSRSQENEADIIGLDYMALAGFDPRDAVTLWRNMAKAGSEPPVFLSDHPSGASRIRDLESHMPQALDEYRRARATGRKPDCGTAPATG